MVQNTQYQHCAVSDRGGIVENTHQIHVAVTDASGKLLYGVGNPSRMTLARSAAKPVQILALLETKGFGEFGFSDADVAMMCSSHSSEQSHITRGSEMLTKVNAREGDLRCGGHPALSEEVNNDWIKRAFVPGALCNNCSAKHIAMLAGAKLIELETAKDYHKEDHPIQLHVKSVFEEVTGLGSDEIKWGIDGCNLPAPALPLRDLSYSYAALARAADVASEVPEYQASVRQQHLARIYRCMWQFPDMVAGKGRFCTELMLQYKGAVVGKLGADGCYGVAVRECEQTRSLGAKGGLGIAVKVEDGDVEILYAVVVEILERLGIGNKQQIRSLEAFHHLYRVNTAGVVTGKVSLPFHLTPY
ncbi:hypothetical protein NCS57_00670900 [Fusarium keratoplasticum]|uniref:Uncharacterized protein n=1 Tax=Fusarium keratoplasticum TaxID=1328300 RepID=A0ACC0QY44_9HYPO|nr:hypothetical protein NCS57_00670900 [Fusarium keratoplasticum]KAI8668592.1 hypothetical protein NCS57_00670900 [Fusarium keratoplasticum]KAI8673215.1 hypothetical protein NCS55_00640700 [Fusarium keratoplasticum]